MIAARLRLEELTRRRRSDDYLRWVESFRCSTIDPNPHQVEAAMFALGRLPQDGALLCDEVGLGKTIEAGLVIAQLRAEGRGHVLIVVPLALAPQWQAELGDLFGIRARVLGTELDSGLARGVYIVGREAATSPRLAPRLAALGPWDLVVVDEAHELFASIYKRFSRKSGAYTAEPTRGEARRAAWLRELVGIAPALLLTATPLQNNVFELWGLVHYVDRQNTVLGPFHEFCQVFVEGDGGRAVVPAMQQTLRTRLQAVLQRTLRAQAAAFLRHPFTRRHCTTLNFHLREAERRLYEDVSRWLAQEEMGAYRTAQRRLVALQLRRRMASSPRALAASLTHLRKRVQGLLDTAQGAGEDDRVELADDVVEIEPALLRADLETLEVLERAAWEVAEATSQKLELVLDLVRRVEARAVEGVVGDKLVIFTESRRTLDSIVSALEAAGLEGQVTAFSGDLDAAEPRVARALAAWEQDVGRFTAPADRPEPASLLRGALVHEFRTRTRVFVSTEAGAKGLNLQFCNCLVNFDLPWNPQRIEQRIGRVHRYGQAHDVIVVNCINLDNEAERRVYGILGEKLRVFEGLLGASDEVLGSMGELVDFEVRINDMLDRCPTPQSVREAFDRLELELDEAARAARDAALQRTRSLISRLDASVRLRLEQIDGAMPAALSRRDRMLLDFLADAAPPLVVERADEARTVFTWQGRRYHLGPPDPGADNGEALGVEHPAVRGCMDAVRRATDGDAGRLEGSGAAWCRVLRATFSGVETEERIVVEVRGEGSGLPDVPGVRVCHDAALEVERLRADIQAQQQPRVERLLSQLASRREDARVYGERMRAALDRRIEAAEKARRLAVTAAEADKAARLHRRLLDERDAQGRGGGDEAGPLSADEQRVHAMRFVRAEAVELFRFRLGASQEDAPGGGSLPPLDEA